jgi:predicted PurR-regulated permease PerM
MWILLQEIPAWLSVLAGVGGVVIAAMNIGRTRWATVLLAGFFAETLAMAFSRLALLGVRQGLTTVTALGAAFLLASLIGLAGRVAVIAGVAGLLSELRGRAQPPRG